MRFKKLIFQRTSYESELSITALLYEHEMYWLVDSEIENAVIEIKNNTLIWHSGDFYSGRWHYGIFKSGKFYGIWENGIFEDGIFSGKFISGIIPDNLLPKK